LCQPMERQSVAPNRPASAAPKLRNWQVAPPWTVVVNHPELESTTRLAYVRPPDHVYGAAWPRNHFKPKRLRGVQPIWQTEALNAPLPSTTSASTFTFHRVPQHVPSGRPFSNSAPYSSADAIGMPTPHSTTHTAFQSVGLPTGRPPALEPHTNPPFFSSKDGPGVGMIIRSTSSDAFPGFGVRPTRISCKPSPNRPPPWTATESRAVVVSSTSKDAFVDFQASRTSRRSPIRPHMNPPPY